MPRIHGVTRQGWWDGHAAPANGPIGTSTIWVGIETKFALAGRVYGVALWDPTGAGANQWTAVVFGSKQPGYPDKLGFRAITLAPSQAAKWHHLWFPTPIDVDTTDTYHVGALFIGGGYFRTNNGLTTPTTRNNIAFQIGITATALDTFMITGTTQTNAVAVDVLFTPT